MKNTQPVDSPVRGSRGRAGLLAAAAVVVAGGALIAQVAVPDYRYRAPSYGYGSVRYGNVHQQTTSSFSRGQVINTNPTYGGGTRSSGLYASRWLLPSENRLAAREQQLQGMMPSQRRYTSYLGTPASGAYTGAPQRHYTDYLGSLSYGRPQAPAVPRSPVYQAVPTGSARPGSGLTAGTVSYGRSMPIGTIAIPQVTTPHVRTSPIGSGTIRYATP